eukprot:scaffold227850_cov35-Prasinocladus_malaysianus.AAC.1
MEALSNYHLCYKLVSLVNCHSWYLMDQISHIEMLAIAETDCKLVDVRHLLWLHLSWPLWSMRPSPGWPLTNRN